MKISWVHWVNDSIICMPCRAAAAFSTPCLPIVSQNNEFIELQPCDRGQSAALEVRQTPQRTPRCPASSMRASAWWLAPVFRHHHQPPEDPQQPEETSCCYALGFACSFDVPGPCSVLWYCRLRAQSPSPHAAQPASHPFPLTDARATLHQATTAATRESATDHSSASLVEYKEKCGHSPFRLRFTRLPSPSLLGSIPRSLSHTAQAR